MTSHKVWFFIAAIVVSLPSLGLAQETTPSFHEGKLVSIAGEKLIFVNSEGKEQSLFFSGQSKWTLDGKNCKAEHLTPGMRVRVTPGPSEDRVVRVDAIEQNGRFTRKRHEATLVRIAGEDLIISFGQGKEDQSCRFGTGTTVTLNGKTVKASDLQTGMRVRVTMESGEPRVASHIQAVESGSEFPVSSRDGTMVSLKGNQLLLSDPKEKREQSCTLSEEIKVTCDGKKCKVSDLRKGMRLRVTLDLADPDSVMSIEAIDKESDFAVS